MDIINICLLTKDVEYGEALSKTLQNENRFFSVTMMNLKESSFPDLGEYDLILTDEDVTIQLDHKVVVRLSEKRSSTGKEGSPEECPVFKYQSSRDIAKDITLIYSRFYGRPVILNTGDKPCVTAVFSAAGGAGCTSVALGLCQELQRFHGRKVLYLSLEEFESTNGYFKPVNVDSRLGLSRFLYHLLYKKSGLESGITEFLLSDEYGVCTFASASGRNPLLDLNEEELIQFLGYLVGSPGFDNILVDCGNSGGLAQIAHLKLADRHVYVGRQEENQLRKHNFFTWLQKSMGEIPHPDPIVVTNFYRDDEMEDNEKCETVSSLGESEPIEIYEDPGSFSVSDNASQIKLDQNFGVGIRDLTRKIVAT